MDPHAKFRKEREPRGQYVLRPHQKRAPGKESNHRLHQVDSGRIVCRLAVYEGGRRLAPERVDPRTTCRIEVT